MSGKLRHKTPLLRALLATTAAAVASPVAGVATVTASVVVLAACDDEQSPSTHVERLDDPRRREAAVRRLTQFYEDAMTKDNKDREGEHVKPLVDEIVPPLVELAQKGELSQVTQGDLLAFLADTRDPRVLPALIKALEDYRMDDKRAEKYDGQMADVVRNIGEMIKSGKVENNAELNATLFELFTKTHYSYPKAQNQRFYQVINNTIKEIADPGWEDRLIGMLNEPFKSTQKKYQKQVLDQVYWQITAAEILGKLESKKAVEPLLKVALSPMKAPVQNDAMIALIRIGKPALDKTLALLEGNAPELQEYAKTEYLRDLKDRGEMPDDGKEVTKVEKKAETAYLDQAARIVANVGTIGAIDPLLSTMEKGDKTTKGIIGSYLYLLPKEQKIIERFQAVYGQTGVNDKLPDGAYTKESLLDAAGSFFDKELMGHILADSHNLKGDKADVQGVQATILGMGVKAATPDQWEHIEKLMTIFPEAKPKGDKYVFKDPKTNKEQKLTDKEIVAKLESLELPLSGMVKEDKEKSAYTPVQEVPVFAPSVQKASYGKAVKQAKIVLDECAEDVSCYMKKLNAPEAMKSETEMQALKSAYMVGLLGDESVKQKLLELLPTIKNPGVRGLVGVIFLNKSPKGDPELAKKLKELYEKAEASRDKQEIDMMKPFKQIIYRLEARAGA